MLRDKKGFHPLMFFVLLGIAAAFLGVIIIFSQQLAAVFTPIFEFLSKWFWLVPITLLIFVLRSEIVLFVRWLFRI